MNRYAGKVAIVTGASAGIGAVIAERLATEGLQVVGLARRFRRIGDLSKTLRNSKGELYALKADITKEEDILKAFKWTSDNLGPAHVLVNNAGVAAPTSLVDGDTGMWRTIFDTNVLGLCIATREAIKIMKSNKIDGHIIHINSVAGHGVVSIPNMNVYPASKYAVTALTETLRQELNLIGSKIKISSISPGAVATEAVEREVLGPEAAEKLRNIPRLKPEDVAEAVAYVLATPPHVQIHELIIKPVGETF